MKCLSTILVIVLQAGINAVSGQSYDALIRAYDEFDRSIPLELLQIETDRDLYLAGENICFTIRGTTINNESLPGISDIICFELINGQNEIVYQQRLRANKLRTNEMIPLLSNWPSGYYTLQAYTAWNRNFGDVLITKKHIKVINASDPRAINRLNKGFQELPQYRVGLHPVYGRLLKNTVNEVIVKAFTKYALPVEGTGIVYNSMQDTLSHFITDASGLGSFEFLPQSGMDHYLQFVTSSGDTLYQSLPPARDGMGMKSICHEDMVELSIQKSTDYYREKQMNLFIASGMNIVYHQEGISRPWENSISVPLPDEPGIYSVFLVTDDLEVEAISTFFHPPQITSLNIRTSKVLYASRERVDLEVDIPEKCQGDTHYSIIAKKDLGLFKQNSLSDWMGYFGGSMQHQRECMNIPVQDQTALVRLMQKYVHTLEPLLTPAEIFEIASSKLNIPPDHGGEILSGVIRNTADNRPVPGQLVVLSFNGEAVQLHTSRTDTNGMFSFYLMHAEGGRQITLSCYPPDEGKTIFINNNYYGNVSGDTIPPVLLSESARMDLEELYLSAQVQEVYREHYESEDHKGDQAIQSFYGKPDFYLDMDKYVQLPVMEEVFFELVRGVMVSKSREGSKLLVIDAHIPNVIGEAPLILVDGVPFLDPDFVLKLNPENVKSIRVVHYKYYLQELSFDGIIDIRIRQGEIRSNDLPSGALSLLYQFKQQAVSTQFPDHSEGTETRSRIPDYRNVLYWNPKIPDLNNIAFYTSDQTGKYVIEVREIRDGKVIALGSCKFDVAETIDY